MAAHSRIDVVLKMRSSGVVPVFYHADAGTGTEVLRAAYRAGLRAFEFTNRGDFAHEVFGQLRKVAMKEMPDMAIGAGTVMDAPTAALFIQLGADFIVSPILDAETARLCNSRKVAWMPGCGSLNDISAAHELGAEVVKIFPATQVGGPAFIKAVKAPCPWASIMPTGGVEPTEANLREWFGAGAWCVGMGSKLIDKKALTDKDYQAIENKISDTLAIIEKIRKTEK